jgi:hypothetical protein
MGGAATSVVGRFTDPIETAAASVLAAVAAMTAR